MSTDPGYLHDMEPETDSRNYFDFEGPYGEEWPEAMPREPHQARVAWHQEHLMILEEEYKIRIDDLMEMVKDADGAAWEIAAKRMVEAGWDIYTSDSRFEVYDPGQPREEE